MSDLSLLTPGERRATILFANTGPSADGLCRREFKGKMTATGLPRVTTNGLRWEDRHRAAYRHWTGERLRATDRFVATCGNPRCLDKRHIRVIPAPVPPKAPRASRARVNAPVIPACHPSPTTAVSL